jgi:hypothetical protein
MSFGYLTMFCKELAVILVFGLPTMPFYIEFCASDFFQSQVVTCLSIVV